MVSIDESGEISDFSSRCGVAQDYCIAAPGGAITVAYPTSSTDTGIYESAITQLIIIIAYETNSCFAVAGGTSFAAPFVSGGLAVIAEYFEGQLGSVEIVNRMFATANKSGIYAGQVCLWSRLVRLRRCNSTSGNCKRIDVS